MAWTIWLRWNIGEIMRHKAELATNRSSWRESLHFTHKCNAFVVYGDDKAQAVQNSPASGKTRSRA